MHVYDLTPYLWSRQPSLEVCFQVGKLRLGALERLASAARGGGPEKDREAQNLQEHNTSHGGEDHGGHFCLCWKTRPHVFLMGAVPEVGGHGKNVGFGPGSHPGSVWPRASCLTSVCLTIIVLVRIK